MSLMQSTKSSKAAPALVAPAAEPDVLDRVIAVYPARLLPGEKQADYDAIAARFVAASKPRDTIEEFLVRDVIDLTWDILRLRRVKTGIIRASKGDGVRAILLEVGYDYPNADKLSKSWTAGDETALKSWAGGDETALKKVNAILTKAGMTIDEVTAKTLESKVDSFERLDRMQASVEARRNNALREIDRHRETLGAAARQAIEEAQDAAVEGGTPE